MRFLEVFLRFLDVFLRFLDVFWRFLKVFSRFLEVFLRFLEGFLRFLEVFLRFLKVFLFVGMLFKWFFVVFHVVSFSWNGFLLGFYFSIGISVIFGCWLQTAHSFFSFLKMMGCLRGLSGVSYKAYMASSTF